MDNTGVRINDSSSLEPADEGTEAELICEANGGRPIPDVKWYNGSEELYCKYLVINCISDFTYVSLVKVFLLLEIEDYKNINY